jgi:hypothetical protein
VDGGTIFGLTSRGRPKIESEIFRFFAGGETKSGSAAGGKLRGVFVGGRTSVCGGVKSGSVVERNMLSDVVTPKWKIADERNKEAKIWEKIKMCAALANYGRYYAIFVCFF